MVERSTLSLIARAIAPTLLGLLGVLVLATPLRLFEGSVPTPLLPLVVIYFWTIYGPGFVPSVSTFAIGLTQDLMLGGPIGVWTIVYLLTQYAVLSQRDYFLGREQHVVWLGFAITAFGAGLLVWGQMSLLIGSWAPIAPLGWQMLVTVFFYPVIAIAFSQFHRRVIIEQ